MRRGWWSIHGSRTTSASSRRVSRPSPRKGAVTSAFGRSVMGSHNGRTMTPASHSPLAVGIDIGTTSVKAVANFALSGEVTVDTATAFSAYPLFDGSKWDEGAVTECGARPEQFPPAFNNGEPVGRVSKSVAAGEAVLGASSIDAMGEQLVAGADREGDVLVILGTTLLTWALIPEWREVPGLWTIPHLGGTGKVFIGGASNAGG